MNPLDIYRIWAPKESVWSAWVRPVSFLNIELCDGKYNGNLPTLHYDKYIKSDTAVFLDMPGTQSILDGLVLALKGHQPIALFNASPAQLGASALVDTQSVTNLLYWGSKHLRSVVYDATTRPVFLLDSNRLMRYRTDPSLFDNSWDLYEQDIPSPKFFKEHGISKILVIATELNRDLTKIFYKFQQQGFNILLSDGINEPRHIKLRKPPKKDKYH